MNAVPLDHLAADPEPLYVVFAKDQRPYTPLPALMFNNGSVMTEWELTEEERTRLIQGERLRLWIWLHPQRCACCHNLAAPKLQPVALQVTSEDKS